MRLVQPAMDEGLSRVLRPSVWKSIEKFNESLEPFMKKAARSAPLNL